MPNEKPIAIDPKMLDLLVCPLARPIWSMTAAAMNLCPRRHRLAYPIRDGIPILLPSEARVVVE